MTPREELIIQADRLARRVRPWCKDEALRGEINLWVDEAMELIRLTVPDARDFPRPPTAKARHLRLAIRGMRSFLVEAKP